MICPKPKPCRRFAAKTSDAPSWITADYSYSLAVQFDAMFARLQDVLKGSRDDANPTV